MRKLLVVLVEIPNVLKQYLELLGEQWKIKADNLSLQSILNINDKYGLNF